MASAQPSGACYLQWFPWAADQEMGFDHQCAALSCAIAEAYYMQRTLVLPDVICIVSRHSGAGGEVPLGSSDSSVPTDAASSDASTRYKPCPRRPGSREMPIEELFDLDTLNMLNPVVRQSELPAATQSAQSAVITWKWTSSRAASAYSCSAVPMLFRRATTSWFRSCNHMPIVNVTPMVHTLWPAAEYRLRRNAHAMAEHLLKSGIFFAARLKAAAAAIRVRLGARYSSVHVRRGDRLAQYGFDGNMTKPDALLRGFGAWFADDENVYIGSDQPDAARFFAPLRSLQPRPIFLAGDFSALLDAHKVSGNNYALYAVERLLFFGAAAHAETFEQSLEWFHLACFPAFAVHQHERESPSWLKAASRCAVSAHGVVYGEACWARCARAMHLYPFPKSCSAVGAPALRGAGRSGPAPEPPVCDAPCHAAAAASMKPGVAADEARQEEQMQQQQRGILRVDTSVRCKRQPSTVPLRVT